MSMGEERNRTLPERVGESVAEFVADLQALGLAFHRASFAAKELGRVMKQLGIPENGPAAPEESEHAE